MGEVFIYESSDRGSIPLISTSDFNIQTPPTYIFVGGLFGIVLNRIGTLSSYEKH